MGKRKDLTTAEKWSYWERISALEISKKLCRDHPIIKNAVENLKQRKVFKNLLLWDEFKLKWVIAKQSLLNSTQKAKKL